MVVLQPQNQFMKIAITGATGHVGANLCRALLQRGDTLKVLDHEYSDSLRGLEVESLKGDVLQPETVRELIKGADVVYHLAARISITGDPGGIVSKTNVDGTANVVNACIENSVKKLIHFSSIHALLPYPLDREINEDGPYDDTSRSFAYNRSKAESEKIVIAAAKKGLNTSIINPTGIIGPYDFRPSLMGQVFLDIYFGRLPSFVSGGFNWVDVRDVVNAAIAAEKSGRSGERYIISGHWTTVKELGDCVKKVTGKKTPALTTPLWLAKASVPFALLYSRITNTTPLFTFESLEALRQYRFISVRKAAEELNYSPRPLEESVRDIYDWFRENSFI